MPELPEVECLARAVREETRDSFFRGVRFLRPDLREPMPVEAIRDALVGEAPSAIKRRSKYLLIETRRGTAILHLGMSGQLLAFPQAEPVKPHTHVIFELSGTAAASSSRYLHFVDPRRFGRLTAVDAATDLARHPWLKDLGPEPLEMPAVELAEHLWRLSRKRKTAIKPFLMDGSVVVGVGNIYASESLFLAGIRPGRASQRISRGEAARLAVAIQKILSAAIAAGGTSFSDYLHPDGSEGSYALLLNVYGRKGEACRKCHSEIREGRHSNRSTFFCPACQN